MRADQFLHRALDNSLLRLGRSNRYPVQRRTELVRRLRGRFMALLRWPSLCADQAVISVGAATVRPRPLLQLQSLADCEVSHHLASGGEFPALWRQIT